MSAELLGGAILQDVYRFLGRFLIYPNEAAQIAHTLWIGHTHLIEAWHSTPRLAFLSPEPASGKTRALEITRLLVPRPVEAVNVSAAYLYRKVGSDSGRPTVLFDEIDTVFGAKARDNEELRGLLNAGHRKGAVAGRCVKKRDTIETEEIEAYCAVALAGLGSLPDTIRTRSIVIPMRRRAPHEPVEQFRQRMHESMGAQLHDSLAAWAETVAELAYTMVPEMPSVIQDRDADMWEPLLVIADLAGAHWPERARRAGVTLVTLAAATPASLGLILLRDLRIVFRDHQALPTDTLLNLLHNLDDAPWADLKETGLGARDLARLLKPYGIGPTTFRLSSSELRKGYRRTELIDAWSRYLPGSGGLLDPSSGNGVTSVTPETKVDRSQIPPSFST
jgi:hypothetical protein